MAPTSTGVVVTVDPSIKGRAKRPTVTFGILVAGSHQLVEGNRSTGSGLALLLNGLGSDIVARDNRARGLITDCFGDASQVWTNNNGRPWRSEPADICSLTATP